MQLSATSCLECVSLKFAANNVACVDLRVGVPFFRQILQGENSRDRTDWHTSSAINTLCGIDVQLSHLIERGAAIGIGTAFCRVDTIDWTYVHTGSVFGSYAWFGDDVRHGNLLSLGSPRFQTGRRAHMRFTSSWAYSLRPVNSRIIAQRDSKGNSPCLQVAEMIVSVYTIRATTQNGSA